MRSQNAIFSFSGGVRSPRLTLRADRNEYTERDSYGASLLKSKNFIVSPQGGAIMREGFKHIKQTQEARIFQFKSGGNTSDLIIEILPTPTFNMGDINIHGDSSIGTVPTITDVHSFKLSEMDDLYFTNRQNTGIVCHIDHPTLYIEQSIIDGSITAREMSFSQVPQVVYNDDKSPSRPYNGAAAVYDITFGNGTGLWPIGTQYYIVYGEKTASFINSAVSTEGEVLAGPGSEYSRWSFTDATNHSALTQNLKQNSWLSSFESEVVVETTIAADVDGGEYKVTITGKNAGKEMRGVVVSENGASITIEQSGLLVEGTEPAWSYPYVVFNDSTMSGTAVVAAGTPNVVGTNTKFLNEMTVGDIIVLGGETHTVLTVTDDVTATLAANHILGSTGFITLAAYYECIRPHIPDTLTEPTSGDNWREVWVSIGPNPPEYWQWQHSGSNDWKPSVEGVEQVDYAPWGRGFPTVCAFKDQRLLLMANKDAGTGIWGSRLADYDDFALGPQSDDPLYFDIDTSDSPIIKWAAAQRRLVLGTSSGDYVVDSEVTLSPSDVNIEKQNNARSEHTAPVVINTNIIYIEQGSQKIRSTSYVRDLQANSSRDISLIAEHLLRSGVKRIVLMQTPEVMVVGLREDGTMLAATYSPSDGVAWYEFEAQHYTLDIAAYYSTVTNEDELWAITSQGYVEGGPNIFYMEKMPYPRRDMTPYLGGLADTTLTSQGVVLMDSWIAGTAINNVITGLEHLNGQVVGALVNDAWTGEYAVSGGQITLDDTNISGSEPYNGESVVGLLYEASLKTFEVATGNQKGTALFTKRRWNKLYVRLLDSALPIINGTLPPDRTPETPMNIAETIRPGLQDVIIRGVGWGNGSIEIVQNRPFPTQIIGVGGEFSSNNA